MSEHRHTTHEHEHEFEAERGLPERLPQGETLLWQGAPDWRALAVHGFHVRKLAVYFGVILAARFAYQITHGASAVESLEGTLWLVPLVLVAIGMALLMAFLTSRTTVYSVTSERVVMRVGIVLSLTFNLPFKHIGAADLHALGGGAGDIALTLDDTTQIAYVHLWPHARPWQVRRTQPMLRALPDAAATATLLTRAWAQARDVQIAAPVLEMEPARGRRQIREPSHGTIAHAR